MTQEPTSGGAAPAASPPTEVSARPPRSRIGWWLGILVLMALVIAGVFYWQHYTTANTAAPAMAAMPPPEVTVANPVYREIVEWDEYTGQFSAVDKVEVRARVSGYIESIQFQDGQIVNAGDPLFVIDTRPFEIDLESAKAQYDEAVARLDVANRQLERTSKLRQSDFAAQTELDERISEAAAAKAALAGAQAAVKSAELNLEYTHITAPISGRISQHLVSEGNLITGGSTGNTTLLTTIVSLDPIYLDFDMSEAEFLAYQRAYEAGKMQSTRAPSVPVQGHLFDEREWTLKGNLNFVDNQVDREAGTVRARAVFPNPNAFITAGQFGRIRIPGSEPYKAILVPDSAIVADQSNKIVLTVAQDGKVVPKLIRPGPMFDELGLRIVREGLEPTDRIIINGLLRARPGAQVSPVDGKIEPVVASN
ncbi:MAG TPA: efflux RND transporter periplasmic adaptor subunit [Dongiaceae bacterium]|jgi:RND family efflux transporter MFP subunit